MAFAEAMVEFLRHRGIMPELVAHPRTVNSRETAHAAHLRGDFVAKAVLLKDDIGYLLAVLPATHLVQLGLLHRLLGREVGLAAEEELPALFPDCAPGAVPPLGQAYGLRTLVDSSLLELPEIYLEAGDHEHLLWFPAADFRIAMRDALFAHFTEHL